MRDAVSTSRRMDIETLVHSQRGQRYLRHEALSHINLRLRGDLVWNLCTGKERVESWLSACTVCQYQLFDLSQRNVPRAVEEMSLWRLRMDNGRRPNNNETTVS